MQESPIGFDEGVSLANEAKDSAIPTFYKRPLHMKKQSEIEGRPVYVDKDFVKIITPGNMKSIVDREVMPADKTRWPRTWARYEAGQQSTTSGTPIDEANFLKAAQVIICKQLGILSVESLANLSDTGCGHLGPGGMDLRKKAQAFITPAPVREQELKAQLAEQAKQIRSLEAMMRHMQGEQPKASMNDAPVSG